MKKFFRTVVAAGAVALALVSTALAVMAAQGALRVYYANDEVGRDVVSILSEAPLETILTRTNKVTGYIRVDPNNLRNNPQVRFEIQAASLDTGIPLRNEHMRGEKWLNTDKYPLIFFKMTEIEAIRNRVDPIKLHNNNSLELPVKGDLYFMGVTHPVSVRVTVRALPGTETTAARLPGDILHVRASFEFKLSDHGLKLPPPVQLKIADTQKVTVDVFTSNALPAPVYAPKEKTMTPAPAVNAPAAGNELRIEELKVGSGATAKAGDSVRVHYRGTLTNGKQFDSSIDRGQPFVFPLGAGRVIQGWDQGVAGMKVGGKRRLTIPPHLAYGDRAMGDIIPANSTLIFEVELLGID